MGQQIVAILSWGYIQPCILCACKYTSILYSVCACGIVCVLVIIYTCIQCETDNYGGFSTSRVQADDY